MDVKVTLVCAVLLVFTLLNMVHAEFLYNRVLPKMEELDALGLECIPGRTIMKVQEARLPMVGGSESDSEEDARRSHMTFKTSDESCQICVCSTEGKDEYCSNRPAMNVNECMRMATITEGFKKNEPFYHERSLSHRIRRGRPLVVDLIWHNDEIPYKAKAKCRRGTSYYSNSITANDTDIDVPSEIESLLDYSNKTVCYYCVCSVDGDGVGCIPRNAWFCEYFREIRNDDAPRHRYRTLFQQDRPAYFRQLSYRLRRTMDSSMFELIEGGGDALCCGHQDGHRRQLHHQVRNKIRLLKRKRNKENLMSGAPGGDYVDFIVNND